MASPSNFTVRMNAMRVLDAKFPAIVDAVEPGGSGDPYVGLNPEQAAALREATLMGFPIRSWFGYRTMGIHAFAAVYGGVLAIDPTYFTDFWTKPGYLGFDHPQSFMGARLQMDTAVATPITAAEAAKQGLNTSIVNGTVNGGVDNAFGTLQGEGAHRIVAFRLAATPPAVPFLGGDLFVTSGAAAGQRLTLSRISGDVVVLGVVKPEVAAAIASGDRVRVDNSNFLAAQTYHRHQVPGTEFVGWNQFRGNDGRPIYPQRPVLLGPLFTKGAAGAIPEGHFDGKMILLESLWDREAFPWQADWYRGLVQQHFGKATDAHFRVWFTDHALHGDSARQEDATHTVSYLGDLQQALRDLAAWVEKGTPPPASTHYKIADAQVIVPPSARLRRGIQPTIALLVNGAERADIAPGATVDLAATIETPPGGGTIIATEWDFDGSGSFAEKSPLSPGLGQAKIALRYRFDKAGTYFVTLRATSQRRGVAAPPYARIANLARVRVVVR